MQRWFLFLNTSPISLGLTLFQFLYLALCGGHLSLLSGTQTLNYFPYLRAFLSYEFRWKTLFMGTKNIACPWQPWKYTAQISTQEKSLCKATGQLTSLQLLQLQDSHTFTLRSCSPWAAHSLSLTPVGLRQAGSFYPMGMLPRSTLGPVALCQPSWDDLRASRMQRLLQPNPSVSTLSSFLTVRLPSRSHAVPAPSSLLSPFFSLSKSFAHVIPFWYLFPGRPKLIKYQSSSLCLIHGICFFPSERVNTFHQGESPYNVHKQRRNPASRSSYDKIL